MNDEHNQNGAGPETGPLPDSSGMDAEHPEQTTRPAGSPDLTPDLTPALTPSQTPDPTPAQTPAQTPELPPDGETAAVQAPVSPAAEPPVRVIETPSAVCGEVVSEDAAPAPVPPPPPREELPAVITVVGVKFRRAGKTYFFICGSLRFSIGEQVIVETDRGLGLARVVTPAFEMESKKAGRDIKRIIRKANWNDLERDRKNKEREEEAAKLCLSKIRERRLAMKLVWVEYYHDASKAVFYFTAEQRVDFRDLVKDLARLLHTRIEMRQIGVRDEAKMCGGLGPCGRPACCNTFLTDFSPVSVRMAKDQNLAMNPAKVSGLCGRLMCCLAYEHEAYVENLKGMPKKGKRMNSKLGLCRVIDLNILTRQVLCELETGKTMFLPAAELYPPDQTRPAGVPEEPEEETGSDVNEDVLDSDDPTLLEKALTKGGGPAPGRSGGPARTGRPGNRDQGPPRRSEPPPPGRPAPPGRTPPGRPAPPGPAPGRDQRNRDRQRPDRPQRDDRPPQNRDGSGPARPTQPSSAPPPGSRPYNKGPSPAAPPGSRPYRPENRDQAPGRPDPQSGPHSGQQFDRRPDQRPSERREPGPAPGNPPPEGAQPPGNAQPPDRHQRKRRRR